MLRALGTGSTLAKALFAGLRQPATFSTSGSSLASSWGLARHPSFSLLGNSARSTPSRPLVIVLHPEEDDKEDVHDMALAAEMMGADDYPSHRKERLRPQDIRKMKANRATSRASVRKVSAVVQLINYRRARKVA